MHGEHRHDHFVDIIVQGTQELGHKESTQDIERVGSPSSRCGTRDSVTFHGTLSFPSGMPIPILRGTSRHAVSRRYDGSASSRSVSRLGDALLQVTQGAEALTYI